VRIENEIIACPICGGRTERDANYSLASAIITCNDAKRRMLIQGFKSVGGQHD
jgi:hypothetical protein